MLTVNSACVIVAMRELLGDPEWAPPEVISAILANDGYPKGLNGELVKHAPVRYFEDFNVRFGADGLAITPDGSAETLRLATGERLVLFRKTGDERGHAECFTAERAVALLEEISNGAPNNLYGVLLRATPAP